MTVTEVTQLLTAAGAFISALAGLHNGRKLKRVHAAVNSSTDQLTAALAAVPPPPDPPARP
jgi:hypothetical protein